MDTIERTAPSQVKLLEELPLRLHHNAYVVKDHEANRKFWEDVIGIPLTATWCERAYNGTMGREIDYCHTFYALADGSALAFFQYADQDAFLNEPGELARSLLKQGVRQMKVWPWDRFAPQLQFAHDTGPAGWTAPGTRS